MQTFKPKTTDTRSQVAARR